MHGRLNVARSVVAFAVAAVALGSMSSCGSNEPAARTADLAADTTAPPLTAEGDRGGLVEVAYSVGYADQSPGVADVAYRDATGSLVEASVETPWQSEPMHVPERARLEVRATSEPIGIANLQCSVHAAVGPHGRSTSQSSPEASCVVVTSVVEMSGGSVEELGSFCDAMDALRESFEPRTRREARYQLELLEQAEALAPAEVRSAVSVLVEFNRQTLEEIRGIEDDDPTAYFDALVELNEDEPPESFERAAQAGAALDEFADRTCEPAWENIGEPVAP
jgi:hypothetical protein